MLLIWETRFLVFGKQNKLSERILHFLPRFVDTFGAPHDFLGRDFAWLIITLCVFRTVYRHQRPAYNNFNNCRRLIIVIHNKN